MRATLRIAISRAVVPLLLVIVASIVIWKGGNCLPNWLANASVRTGVGVDAAVKLLVGAMFAAAALAVLYRRLAVPIAWVTLVSMAFVGLAELSALFAAPGEGVLPVLAWLLPLIALVLGALGVWGLGSTAPTKEEAAAIESGRVTPWRVLVAIVVLAVSAGVAARLTVQPRDARQVGGIEFVDLDVASWVGKTLPATGLARRLPDVTRLTLEGTKWIVFFQPSCGRCHDVFRVYFAGDQEGSVIAIEVPHAPDSSVLESDQPEEIECTNCARLTLASGVHWGITTPTIVKVEEGIVTCVTSSDYGRCREGSDEAR